MAHQPQPRVDAQGRLVGTGRIKRTFGGGIEAEQEFLPFDPIQSLLIQRRGAEFRPGAEGARSIESAQGRIVAREQGSQRFVIPLPKRKSRTFGVGIGGLNDGGSPAFSAIGGFV